MGRPAAPARPGTAGLPQLNATLPRIAVFGAGAIGLYLSSRLLAAGLPVTLVTRAGKTLPLPLTIEEGETSVTHTDFPMRAAEQASPQDFVIVAIKAQELPAAWLQIRPWLGAAGQLVVAQNGLPWWFLHGLDTGAVLHAADPDGRLLHEVDLGRTIACVIHKSVDRVAPDHIRAFAVAGDRFVFGRPLGSPESPADLTVERLLSAFSAAGLAAEASGDVAAAIWDKLLGNAVLNPLSAITGLDIRALLADPAHYQTIVAGMREAQAVALANGLPPSPTPEERLARTAQVAASGHFRTSMLQDRAAGKSLELEPIVGAVLELARRRALSTPTLERLYAEARQLTT